MTTASDNYIGPGGAVGNVSDCRSRGRELISAQSSTLAEIDHEIISTAVTLSRVYSRRVVVNNKRKYVQKVPVNCLVKLAQEKCVVR